LIIEKLTENRLDEFIEVVSKMVSEAQFCYAVPEKSKIINLYKSSNTIGFLAIENNEIIGFISGILSEYFFSNTKRASDLGFFVLPKFRGSSAAIKLVKSLESWAKEQGADDLYLGQTTAVEIDKTRQFYERLGYKTVGFNAVKHLKE
jgi:GNAT superfamily N-acetyltransferase